MSGLGVVTALAFQRKAFVSFLRRGTSSKENTRKFSSGDSLRQLFYKQSGNTIGCTRFVESCDHKQWGYYTTKREGERERAIKKQLEKRYKKILYDFPTFSTIRQMLNQSREADRIRMEEVAVLRRLIRVRALPRENHARAFLKCVNRLKED